MTYSLKKGPVLGFRVSAELLDRLDHLAERDRRSRSQMARLLIEEALRLKEAATSDESASDGRGWQA